MADKILQQKIIIITDAKNEIDDQFALTYALRSPEIQVVGVIATHNTIKHGRSSLDLYFDEAEKIVNLSGKKTPVLRGSRRPFNPNNSENSEGVQFLINQLLTSGETIRVICIGPCTDLANGLALEPTIKDKAEYFWLGGFASQGIANQFRHKELNFLADTRAATKVLDEIKDLSIIPVWGAAERLVVSIPSFAEDLSKVDSPLSLYLRKLLIGNWSRFKPWTVFIPHILKRYWVLSDVAAVAAAKNFQVEIRKSSCKIEGKKFAFDNGKTINIIHLKNEHQILADMKDCILKNT